MKLYIVRHGETLFNIKRICQGWCDSPLTDKGIFEAEECGTLLKNIDFDCVYVSPSGRALDTMKYIIGDRDLKIFIEPDLKERNFGDMEGEHFESFPSDYGDYHDFDGYIKSHGGETSSMALKRALNALMKIGDKYDGNVLVVTHGALINFFVDYLNPQLSNALKAEGKYIGNCSISIVEYENGQFKYLELLNNQYQRGK